MAAIKTSARSPLASIGTKLVALEVKTTNLPSPVMEGVMAGLMAGVMAGCKLWLLPCVPSSATETRILLFRQQFEEFLGKAHLGGGRT